MPFGNPGKDEFGTYYISYAATPSVTEEMLSNMFIGRPPGNTDRILDFSTAVTGSLFFAPAADFLDDPPGPPGADEAAAAAAGDAGHRVGHHAGQRRVARHRVAQKGLAGAPSASTGAGK